MLNDFKQLLETGRDRDLCDVFLGADSEETGLTPDEILAALQTRHDVMWECVKKGQRQGMSMGKLVGNEAAAMAAAYAAGNTFLDALTVKAMIYSLAVMDENARMGVIVAAPTAGAGGVVPGMLLALEEERKVDPKRTVRGLVVAGGIGSLISLKANISGAAGGCQNEIGVATSMGAGAAAYMMGGTTRQCVHAAAMALKNVLGLVCDPVGGLVEVPCVKRNSFYAVHGLTSAQLALAGVESIIPMDEIIDAMVRIGRALPRGLKETAEGGLAVTPTGNEIAQRIKDEANAKRQQKAEERERIAAERKASVEGES